jgi:hydrogenase-1 operon protein HyaF
MNGLHAIPVELVSTANEHNVTAGVRALLTEISTMLSALITEEKTDSIDLRSLPLLPAEHAAIKTILGAGEITANFYSMGASTIYETALAGVWWVNHCNEDGDQIADIIEISRIPEILKSQPEDIEVALTVLEQQLQEWADNV